jgi:hypothetical protein
MSTTVGTTVTLDDVLTEGSDGQYVEVDLTDAAGTAISTGAIVGITGTLRSLDTEEVIFGGDTPVSMASRASYPGDPGVVRITFTAADMVSKGSRQMQTRELTLIVTHSTDKVFHCAVRFQLQNLRDVA